METITRAELNSIARNVKKINSELDLLNPLNIKDSELISSYKASLKSYLDRLERPSKKTHLKLIQSN